MPNIENFWLYIENINNELEYFRRMFAVYCQNRHILVRTGRLIFFKYSMANKKSNFTNKKKKKNRKNEKKTIQNFGS